MDRLNACAEMLGNWEEYLRRAGPLWPNPNIALHIHIVTMFDAYATKMYTNIYLIGKCS